ncbi:hypothetical protein [Modestobacter sp. Leaf380]|uniref:hypothetical protein n=1 Tax=Modestobacter sp. Leaf380 TaxID=1736356 RepID=UPI0006FCBD4C|nr:hypothetical protein [Modestobacter sp. Leaf380]KQS63598.1 hypothetical protein ASG41_18285 [Modestobacter sp. Leaf380]
MTGRDRQHGTTESPAVDAAGRPRLPGDRVATHVVGPWVLGTRDVRDEADLAGAHPGPATGRGVPRRLLVRVAVGAGALVVVVALAAAAGSAITPGVSTTGAPTVGSPATSTGAEEATAGAGGGTTAVPPVADEEAAPPPPGGPGADSPAGAPGVPPGVSPPGLSGPAGTGPAGPG